MKKITSLLFFVFLLTNLYSQERILIDPSGTIQSSFVPRDLVEKVLINSPCATIDNVTYRSGNNYNGADFGFKSYGYFEKGSSNFPIENGIILSTASVNSAVGPNDNMGNSEGDGTGWGGDSDIETILNRDLSGSFPTFNATVLEFDFIPLGDHVSFDYLFASEEYDQNFVCPTSTFQDGFAFIISGPGIKNDIGIDGKNIALVNNNTPVSAGTVNGGALDGTCGASNQQFYYSYNSSSVAGISGTSSPANAPIDFMGRTTVFKAESDVVPNEKYHIKLVVAERADGQFSSAVFLAGGSFTIGIDLGEDRTEVNNKPVCEGDTVVLNAGNFDGATYQWFEISNPSLILGNSSSYSVSRAGTYRVEVTLGTNCISSDELVVEYNEPPKVNTTVTLKQCDTDTDGFSDFNLEEINDQISSDVTVSRITYFTNRESAELDNSSNRILIPTVFNSNSSSVYARVENQFGCFNISEIKLIVSTTSIPSSFVLNYRTCDTEMSGSDVDGIANFDFSASTAEIIKLFPAGQSLSVTYYETIADGLAEKNALDPTNHQNINAPFNQQIVVRVDSDDNNDCLGLGFHITLRVDPLPEFMLNENVILCLNNLPLNISGEDPNDDYSYQWFDNNNNPLSEGNSISYNFFNSGEYTLIATTKDGTNCSRAHSIKIEESNIATIDNIIVVDDSENNMITAEVSGEGSYEFALDNINGFYQDENVFENVEAGLHVIYVRDKNGCGVVEREVSVIGFPRFFTPNGDGINDTWQVLGVRAQPKSKIYVFDRYGKMLIQLDAQNDGWNGTYNGRPLPSSDYWFLVELDDGRTRRGHFSLIRR